MFPVGNINVYKGYYYFLNAIIPKIQGRMFTFVAQIRN